MDGADDRELEHPPRVTLRASARHHWRQGIPSKVKVRTREWERARRTRISLTRASKCEQAIRRQPSSSPDIRAPKPRRRVLSLLLLLLFVAAAGGVDECAAAVVLCSTSSNSQVASLKSLESPRSLACSRRRAACIHSYCKPRGRSRREAGERYVISWPCSFDVVGEQRALLEIFAAHADRRRSRDFAAHLVSRLCCRDR